MDGLLIANLVWPIAGAIFAGGAIGAEREFRSSPAGFRTHILVSLSSGLLMLAAVHQMHWLTDTPDAVIRIDPVRMAHGVLTGIGFLCGGVIFREGFTIRGLTTAASLWSAAALGMLFGVGFYGLAIGGTLVTIAVLAAASLSERVLPRQQYADLKVRYPRAADVTQKTFGDLLAAHGLKASAISQAVDGDTVEFFATVEGRSPLQTEALAEHLRRDPQVTGFSSQPHMT